MAQLSVWTRLCTMACRLCKLPAFPSLGMRPGGTSFTCGSRVIEAFHRTGRVLHEMGIEEGVSERTLLSLAGRSGTGRWSDGWYGRVMEPWSHLVATSSPSRALSNGSAVFSTRSAASTNASVGWPISYTLSQTSYFIQNK